MANVAEELVVRLTADVANLRAQMDEISARVTADNQKIVDSTQSIGASLKSAMQSVVAFWGAFEAKAAIESLVHANIAMQQIQYTLEYATGSAQAAAKQMSFLSQVSNALGINLQEAGMQFARLLSAANGQAISIQTLQSLYIGLAKTFDILHASTYAQQRVMNTFTEMMTMGTIHAQQLRMMLGRDLPGVNFMSVAAKELGMTTEQLNELMQKGHLTATVLMPALAKGLNDAADKGNALRDAIHGTNATLNRFHTAVFEIENELAEKFTPAGAAAVDQITQIGHALAPLNPQIQENSASFSTLRAAANDIAEAFLFLKAVVVTVFDTLQAVIRNGVDGAVNSFYFLKASIMLVVHSVEYLWEAFKGFATGSVGVLGGVGQALDDLTHGHFAAARAAVQGLGKDFSSSFNITPATIAVSEDLGNMADSVKLTATESVQDWALAGKDVVSEWKTTMDQLDKISRLGTAPANAALPKVTPQGVPQIAAAGLGVGGGGSGDLGLGSLESSMPTIKPLDVNAQTQKALSQQYEQYLKAMDAQAQLSAQNQKRAAEQVRQSWMQAMNPIANAFDQALTGMMRGTQNVQQVVRNMLQNIVASYIQSGVRMVERWIANEAAQTAATATGNAARLSIQASADAASHSLAAASGTKTVMQDAAKAFSGTYASVAQIPYVGWILAPAAATAAFAAVAAYQGLASLDVGTPHIPQTGLYMLHQGEAVMPKTWAQGMRNGDLGAMGGEVSHHYHGNTHISALDSQSIERMFKRNRSSVLNAAAQAWRMGARPA